MLNRNTLKIKDGAIFRSFAESFNHRWYVGNIKKKVLQRPIAVTMAGRNHEGNEPDTSIRLPVTAVQ